MFDFINTADDRVRSDLEEWSTVAANNVKQAIENDSPLRGRIEANARLISLIQEGALLQAEDFRGVRRAGNLQAGAIVTDLGECLYVDFLVTAPWNITEDSPKSVRRAATMLMALIVRESRDQGYEGRIMVDAVGGTAEFYRRMGFIETEFSSTLAPEMVLTPEAARDFLDDLIGE